MRVCIATTVHGPRDGRIFYREARTLSRAGHEVFVLHAAGEGEQSVDGIDVLGLAPPTTRRDTKRLGRRMVREALLRRPDVVHVHDPALLAPCANMCGRGGAAFLYEARGHSGTVRLPLRRRRLLRRAAGVIAADARIGLLFEQLHPRVAVARSYPPSDLFAVPETAERNEIVCIGRRLSVARTRPMLEVFADLRGEFADLRLALIEQEQADEELNQLVAERSGDSVTIETALPYEQLADRLAGAAIGVAVVSDGEEDWSVDMPAGAFELMALHIPYVAVVTPAFEKLVGNVGGRLVRAEDADSLVTALRELCARPEARHALGWRGRWAFEQKYNWEREAAGLVDLYGEIADASAGDAA